MKADNVEAHANVHWAFVMMATSSFGKVEHRSFSQVSLTSETVEAKRSTVLLQQTFIKEMI